MQPRATAAGRVVLAGLTALVASGLLQSSPAGAGDVAEGPAADPRIDRAGLAPTARGAAPGTLVVSSEELLLLGASYVLPDSTQLSGRLLPPIIGGALGGIAQVTRPIVRAGRLQLAVLAGFAGIEVEDFSATFLGGGLAAGICLDRGCESVLSGWGALGHGRYFSKERNRLVNSEPVLVFGPNLLLALAPHLKLVAEIDATTSDFSGLLAIAALRIYGRSWAVDLGGLRMDGDLVPLFSAAWRPDLTGPRRPATPDQRYVPPAARR